MKEQNNAPKNAEEALKKLMEGNERFINGVRSIEPLHSHLKMAELSKKGQKPFVIVLTCSDSRSPVEMIFDQGIGDVFVIRVAGNVVAPSLLASIEFAAANFGSPLILVMGHSQCGAVKATLQHCNNPSEALPSPHLEELISKIRPAVEKVAFSKFNKFRKNESELLELCTIENVKRSIDLIHDQSSIVRNLSQQSKIKIKGAILDIATGKVKIIQHSVTQEAALQEPLYYLA